jgi:FAD/FMN-containing dehydrogenase
MLALRKRMLSNIPRGNFKKLTVPDIEFFKSTTKVLSAETENLDHYNQDWMNKYKGHSKFVLKPKTTLEISKILKYCNEQNIGVCTQAGNTGLVGGSIPVHDEIIINTSDMNKVVSFDSTQGILEAESGAILEKLDDFLRERGFIMPLGIEN